MSCHYLTVYQVERRRREIEAKQEAAKAVEEKNTLQAQVGELVVQQSELESSVKQVDAQINSNLIDSLELSMAEQTDDQRFRAQAFRSAANFTTRTDLQGCAG